MNISHSIDLQALLTDYQNHLTQLSKTKEPEIEEIVAVLYSRDAIDEARTSNIEFPETLLKQLVDLDETLRTYEQVITDHPKYVSSRQTVNPSPDAWWWYFTGKEAHVEENVGFWQAVRQSWFQYDWFWNTITVACLVGAGSYAANTAQALSDDSVDLLQKFATISQGAGLVLVTGGTLTKRGQEVISEGLTKMGIKPKYQSEVTCGFSVVLLATTWGISQSLPFLGDIYYKRGVNAYQDGDIRTAQTLYERARSLDPERPEINIRLGTVYYTVSRFADAQTEYANALSSGYPSAFDGLGRTLFRQVKTPEDVMETISLFQLGIAKENQDSFLNSIMYANLGFAYIRYVELSPNMPLDTQKEWYFKANLALRESLRIEQRVFKALEKQHNLTEEELFEQDLVEAGTGMGYCYMGVLYDKLKAGNIAVNDFQEQQREETADYFWEECQKYALPESLAQYRDIATYGDPEIARHVEVSKIIRTSDDFVVVDHEDEAFEGAPEESQEQSQSN